MGRPQKQLPINKSPLQIEAEVTQMDAEFRAELENNPIYALEVDPTGEIGMSDTQKLFIKYYCDYLNIPVAAELAGIDNKTAGQIFTMESTEKEIRRINRARYLRRFNHKLISIEHLAGWLSSLITDEDVPVAERLKTTDKVRVASMLIDINNLRRTAYDNPDVVMTKNIEEQLKDASIDTIKQLITMTGINNDTDKAKVLDQLKSRQSLTPEEIVYLKSLPIEDLLKLLDVSAKEEKK